MNDNPYFRVEKVVDGVFACLATDMEKAWGNTAIVDMGDKTVVFDTFNSPDAGQVLHDVALELTGREPTVVINSHHHGDHVLGNQCFAPAAEIIATTKTRQAMEPLVMQAEDSRHMLAARLNQLQNDPPSDIKVFRAEVEKLKGEIASIQALKITLPTLTFEDRLVLHGSKRRAELLSYGGGHTVSDAFLLLPDEGIILTADLLFQGELHPWVGHGNPDEWITILEKMLELPAGQYIPGHGNVGDRTDLERQLTYMRHFAAAVEQKRQNPDMEIVVPEAYAEWEGAVRFARGVELLA